MFDPVLWHEICRFATFDSEGRISQIIDLEPPTYFSEVKSELGPSAATERAWDEREQVA